MVEAIRNLPLNKCVEKAFSKGLDFELEATCRYWLLCVYFYLREMGKGYYIIDIAMIVASIS